jgi:hypothetical protein
MSKVNQRLFLVRHQANQGKSIRRHNQPPKLCGRFLAANAAARTLTRISKLRGLHLESRRPHTEFTRSISAALSLFTLPISGPISCAVMHSAG